MTKREYEKLKKAIKYFTGGETEYDFSKNWEKAMDILISLINAHKRKKFGKNGVA